MARHDKKSYELSEAEQRDLVGEDRQVSGPVSHPAYGAPGIGNGYRMPIRGMARVEDKGVQTRIVESPGNGFAFVGRAIAVAATGTNDHGPARFVRLYQVWRDRGDRLRQLGIHAWRLVGPQGLGIVSIGHKWKPSADH